MNGGKIRECATKVSGSFAFKGAAFTCPSDHCLSILTATNCQITTDLLQTSGPGIKRGSYSVPSI